MAEVLQLSIARTADGNGLPLPSYSSRYHMALNLQAAIPAALRLEPGDRAYIPVGFAIGVPDGYCGFVVSQPALAKEQGLIVLDAPQVIHPADRDPVFVLLQNMSSHVVVLHRGNVVAQLVVQQAFQVAWRDLSAGAVGAGVKTKDQNLVIDSTGTSEEATNSKMVSSRRTYKSPRRRFAEEEKKEDE